MSISISISIGLVLYIYSYIYTRIYTDNSYISNAYISNAYKVDAFSACRFIRGARFPAILRGRQTVDTGAVHDPTPPDGLSVSFVSVGRYCPRGLVLVFVFICLLRFGYICVSFDVCKLPLSASCE